MEVHEGVSAQDEVINLIGRTVQQWIIISICVVVGLGASLVVTVLQRPVYSATAAAYISVGAADNISDLSLGASYTDQVVKSYEQIAVAPIVLDKVSSVLGLASSGGVAPTQITTNVPIDTSVLEVSATSGSARGSADLANAVVSQLNLVVPGLNPSTTSASGPVKFTQITYAVPPAAPAEPRLAVYLLVGLLGGLVAGIGIAAVRVKIDTRVHDASTLERVADLAVLAQVPTRRREEARGEQLQVGVQSVYAEALRHMRVNFKFAASLKTGCAYAITSSVPGEGKSEISVGFAEILSQSGQHVLLIDADLRRPTISVMTGIDSGIGLSDVISGQADLDAAIQEWGPGRNVHILPSGPLPPNPTALLESAYFATLLAEAQSRYDYVIIDTPPVLAVSDSLIVAAQCAGTVVVVGVDKVRVPQVRQTLATLKATGGTAIGFVNNFAARSEADAYSYTSRVVRPVVSR